ncbi:hypothetical protein BMR07_11570 [Methylococcaceae bacterium CS1]|nr:hypothetical protein BMR07_11570 [Methylococcaceae bacterium CS1]
MAKPPKINLDTPALCISATQLYGLTILKIDQSFIQNIITSPEDQAVVQAMISMIHALDKKVIAAGVETPEQLQFLQESDCDIAQGYCFSKPSLAEQVTLYISQIFN